MIRSLIRISARNVVRNTRRSLITALAVLIGCFFIIMARGILNGLQNGMIAAFTETQAGDVQLHRAGYLEAVEAFPLDRSFELGERVERLLDGVDGVRAYAGRILFTGMVSNGEDTTLFVGMGVDPENEYRVCPRNRRNVLPGGTALRPDAPRGVVIGKALARSLGAEVGSELTLLVTPRPGGISGMDVTVVGVAEFKIPGVGNRVIHMPLPAAQKLLYMDHDVTEVVIDVEDQRDVEPVCEALRARLDAGGNELDLEPNTWMDVGQFYVSANEIQDQVLAYIIAVLFVIMVAGIVNTMLLSVFERTREIGTLMAIGVKRNRILALFFLESLILSAVGAVAGVVLGAGVVAVLERTGMPLPAIGNFRGTHIHPSIDPGYLLVVIGVALSAAVVAAIYPAWRASRMDPATALRSI